MKRRLVGFASLALAWSCNSNGPGADAQVQMPDASVEDSGTRPDASAHPMDAITADAPPADTANDTAQVHVDAPTSDGTSATSDGGTADAGTDPRDQPGVFAVVGNQGAYARSIDNGNTWIDEGAVWPGQTGDDRSFYTVVWGNNQFVSVGWNASTSSDGQSWSTPMDLGQWVGTIVYAENQYVSAGGYGWLATSADGITWNQYPSPDAPVAHHGSATLAFGVVNGVGHYVSDDDNGAMYYSTDGAHTWQASTGAPMSQSGELTFGNGAFVGVVGGSAFIVSVDGGATWSAATGSAPSGVQGLIFAQGHFTAVGSQNVYTSTTGQSWTTVASPNAMPGSIAYGNGTYILLSGGTVQHSTDGVTWTGSSDLGSQYNWNAVAFGPNA